jgi:hypothetical protein
VNIDEIVKKALAGAYCIVEPVIAAEIRAKLPVDARYFGLESWPL